MLGVTVVYAGLAALAVGIVSLIKPLKSLRVRTRARAALVSGVGLALVGLGLALPARETRVEVPRTHLDSFVSAYQFSEVHRISIDAPTDRVYQAIQQVTANEILFFRTLTWIRRLGRPGPEHILNAPGDQPLLEVATRTTFVHLVEEPGREIVVGTVVISPPTEAGMPKPTPEEFRNLDAPGFARAAMNFRIEATGPKTCTLITETRVHATDASARRRFAAYWRVISPGSALIRRMWLRAIRVRAEASPAPVF